MATLILRPNAAGASTQLTAVPGTPNWGCVDENPASDSDYVWNSVNSINTKLDLYALPNHTIEDGVISKIEVFCRAKRTYQAYGSFRIAIKGSPTTKYYSTARTASTSWTNYSYVWTTNPGTSQAWTWQNIDDLQIGFEANNYTGEVIDAFYYCSQIYVEITYTPAANVPASMHQMKMQGMS